MYEREADDGSQMLGARPTALSTIAVESDEVARSWSLIGVLVCTGGVSGEKEDQQGTYDEPRSVKD